MNMIQSSVKWKWWRLCYAGECAAALCRHSGHAAEAMHCLCYALTLYAWSIATAAGLHGLWCGTCSSQQAREHDMNVNAQVDFLPAAAMSEEDLEKQRQVAAELAKRTRWVDFEYDGMPAQVRGPGMTSPLHTAGAGSV